VKKTARTVLNLKVNFNLAMLRIFYSQMSECFTAEHTFFV